jgi:flagellar biosynthesis/type III secretory pathway protein FliH
MHPPGYCFPEISRTAEKRSGKRDASAPAFQRQAPGSRATACRLGKPRTTPSHEQARVDLEQEAYSRGFADGEKSGFDLGERAGREGVSARLEKALKSLEKMNSDLQRLQNNVCRELERETVQLALEVARKIVGREVQTDVQAVTRMVRTGLSRLENAEHITIRMNPEDMQRVAEFAPRMLAEITDAERVRFEGDAAISCGGCRIESDSGDIDARLERQLKAVEAAFQSEWNKEAVHPG